MPELPEAETIARGLRGPVTGARILGVEVIHPDIVEGDPGSLPDTLTGRRVLEVGRRGKNLVLRLDDHARLVVNLGMSGRLLWRGEGDPSPPPTHPALRIPLAGVTRPPAPTGTGALVYHDPRRFGRIRHLSEGAWRSWSRGLGPEPLARGFTARKLGEGLSRSRSPLRSWLLDQRKVAGVGNIYASEACFLARLHPQLPANQVGPEGARRLHRALRQVLSEAVERGGTTLRDYRTAEGWEGSYQHALRAYGRADEPCTRCSEPLRRVVFSNRSAFYCPRCQPLP